MTFRLKRRNALSIDSPGLMVTTAINISNQALLEDPIKHVAHSCGQVHIENPASDISSPRGAQIF